MKRTLSFFNDTIVVFALLFVISVAFLATYALSPVAFEKSILAQNENYSQNSVLGIQDNKLITYQNIFTTHAYFDVAPVTVNEDYVTKISIGPVSKGQITKPIVKINNPGTQSRKMLIKLAAAESEIQGMDAHLTVDGNEVELNKETNSTVVNIGGGSSKDIGIDILNSQNVYYSVNFDLTISPEN
jgi:hypothetical protein